MLRYFDKILLLFCIGSTSLSWAQCPTNIQLGSQAEVNQFTTLFPGCSEPINLTITRSVTQINWTTSASDLKINTYPNPAAVFFHLEFPGPGQLAIYSPTGERLLQRSTDGKSLVDCASWPRGMHLVKWTAAGREVVERIMIN